MEERFKVAASYSLNGAVRTGISVTGITASAATMSYLFGTQMVDIKQFQGSIDPISLYSYLDPVTKKTIDLFCTEEHDGSFEREYHAEDETDYLDSIIIRHEFIEEYESCFERIYNGPFDNALIIGSLPTLLTAFAFAAMLPKAFACFWAAKQQITDHSDRILNPHDIEIYRQRVSVKQDHTP